MEGEGVLKDSTRGQRKESTENEATTTTWPFGDPLGSGEVTTESCDVVGTEALVTRKS